MELPFIGRTVAGRQAFFLAFFLVTLAGTMPFLLRSSREMPLGCDLTIPEGSIVYSIRAAAHGGDIYRDYRRPPYATTAYPPLFYLVAGRFTALQDGSVAAAYRSGRLLTLASTVACAFLVGLLAKEAEGSWMHASYASLLTLTVPIFCPWGYTCRPDLLAVALSLSGMYVVLKRPGKLGGVAVASVLFLLALFTKQVTIAAPIAFLWSLLRRRSWSRASLAGSMLIVGLVTFGVLSDRATCGRFFQNVVEANVAPLKAAQVPVLLLAGFLLPLFPAGLLSLSRLLCLRNPSTASTTLRSYWIASLVVATALSAKAGADVNYFIEPCLVTCVLAGPGLRSWILLAQCLQPVRLCLGVVLAVQAEVSWVALMNRDIPSSDLLVDNASARLFKTLTPVPGDVLFSDSGLAIRSGRPVLMLDRFNASYLSERGVIDVSPLVSRLRREEIGAVVLDSDDPFDAIQGQGFWPRPVAFAIAGHYTCVEHAGRWRILRPNGTLAGR